MTRRFFGAVAVGLVGLALSFGVAYLFGLFTHLGFVVHVDRPFDLFFDRHRWNAMVKVMDNVTLLGSYTVDFSIAGAAGLLLCLLSRRLLPIPVLLAALPVEVYMQKAMTSILHGPEPSRALSIGPPGGYFSGGSARAALVCGLVAYFVGWVTSDRLTRRVMWSAAVLAVFLEGVSRLYLGRHFAVDIVGGWLFGGLALASAIIALERLQPDMALRVGWGRRERQGAMDSGARTATRAPWPGVTGAWRCPVLVQASHAEVEGDQGC